MDEAIEASLLLYSTRFLHANRFPLRLKTLSLTLRSERGHLGNRKYSAGGF